MQWLMECRCLQLLGVLLAACQVSLAAAFVYGDDDHGVLRQRVADAVERTLRRLGEGLIVEACIADGWDVAAAADRRPWSLLAYFNAPGESAAAALYALASVREGKVRAHVRGGMVLDGAVWELVAADYVCAQDAPPEGADVLAWLQGQRPLTRYANLNIANVRDPLWGHKARSVYHRSGLLCAIGACVVWENGEPIWIGPRFPGKRPSMGDASVPLLSQERHSARLRALRRKDRGFVHRRFFDAALPVLVREAQTISVEPDSGLIVVEADATTLWLAPKYGYLPVRREWYCVVKRHLLAVDEFTDYRQLGERVWLPFRWRRVHDRSSYQENVPETLVYVVRRAEWREVSKEELRNLFLDGVPEERTIVVDFRWLRHPLRPGWAHVAYPFRRDPHELERLRKQAVARARARMAWFLRMGGGRGSFLVPLTVAALFLAVVAFLVWLRWRRRKQDA